LQVVRSWPISGYEIINADDSSVLVSKTGAGFDPADQDDTLLVGHAVDRVRVRMFYTDPTEASALPTHATVWWGCGVGCSGPATVTSGEWTTPISLSVGDQTLGLYASINNWYPYEGTAWRIRTTRASAFSSITSVTLPGVPTAGTPVPAGSPISVTPSGVSGSPTPTVTYDWEAADDTTFTTSTVVATTTAPSWTPDNSVADKFVRVTATADNGISTPTTVTSSAFGPIAAVNAAPTLSGASISGTAEVGVALTASVSGLTGYPAPTVTYAWEASPDGASFSPVGSGSSYTPNAGDEGSVMRVTATADNGVGSAATATSSVTAAVIAGVAGGPGDPVDPGVPPSSPFEVVAVAGDASAVVTWSPPANVGDFPVTTYQVKSSPGGEGCLTEELTCVVEDLTNGTAYTMSVRALSGAGWSAWSAPSAQVTPSADSVPVPSITLERVARSKAAVGIAGTTVAVSDGQTVRIRVAKFKAKTGGWTKFRTVSRVQVSDGGFAADLRWGTSTKIRVLAKAPGVARSNILRIVR